MTKKDRDDVRTFIAANDKKDIISALEKDIEKNYHKDEIVQVDKILALSVCKIARMEMQRAKDLLDEYDV